MTGQKRCSRLFDFIAHNRLRWLVLICVIGFVCDQGSKIWVQKMLAEPYEVSQEILVDGEPVSVKKQVYYPIKVVEVIPNLFNLIYKENPAAAFSLTKSVPEWFRRPMLIIVSVIATIFFLVWYFRMKGSDGLLLGAFSLILSGALGNLVDRVRLGYVIDFLDVYAGILGYPYLHWPTFNIADSLIVAGAIGVMYRTFWPLKVEAGTGCHTSSQVGS